MCGIAGIVDTVNAPQKPLLEKMCAVMGHRGPDGEGYFMGGPATLGHRRLSIIDIEGGAQPLANEDSTLWITFNGEIYNFKDVREELVKKGHRFSTKSDTETIIHAYEEWGEKCLERFRGMFAFAIWDVRKKELFIARDRLGKKPLYYHHNGSKFVFASELKAILQDRSVNRTPDPKAIADYLTYHYVPFPGTIFKDIHKLPPGCFMRVTLVNGGGATKGPLKVKTSRYWDVKYEPDYTLTEDEWVEALRAKIKEAVGIRLISDVPLGAFLSGGVDSSAVVAMMSGFKAVPVKTFSVGFKEKDFTEARYAREVAQRFSTDHHEIVVEPDAIELLPRLAWEFDEPFADSSAVPTYYVSKMAREHVTVVLSGDGGDETFAGYRRYLWSNDMKRYDLMPALMKKVVFGGPAAVLPEGMRGKGMLEHLSKDPFKRYAGLNTYGDPRYLDNILSKDIRAALEESGNGRLPDYAFLRMFYDSAPGDYLSKIQYLDTKTYLAEDILTKVDRASMLNSIETRAPLLDHEVVELAARIPPELKIKNGETKYILKKAMKGVLPDGILGRKKMGFGVPLVHWFKKDLVDYAREVLLSREARERGIFNHGYIETMLENHKKRGRDLSAKIWALLFFEHWSRNWL